MQLNQNKTDLTQNPSVTLLMSHARYKAKATGQIHYSRELKSLFTTYITVMGHFGI